MPFFIVKDDITTFDTDAIVSSANHRAFIDGGVEESIYDKAGPLLMKERKEIGTIPYTASKLTKGYELDCEFVIHTVAPVYTTKAQYQHDLAKSYQSALSCATAHNLESIAFPLLGSGAKAWPKEHAISIAISTITQFLETVDMDVYLVLYESYQTSLSKRYNRQLKMYLNRFVTDQIVMRSMPQSMDVSDELSNIKKQQITSFKKTLFDLIDERQLTDAYVYKKANIDRRVFSKIRTKQHYLPSKKTIIALALALELDLTQTRNLLQRAGYYLTKAIEFDLMIIFFIENEIYDILEINILLDEYGHDLLGQK